MSSQIPFTPLTPESMARLTLDEQMAFEAATMTVAQDQKPSLEVIATVVLTVQRLLGEAPAQLRERPGDQQLPVPNDGPSMHDLVIADLEHRYPQTASRDAITSVLLERKQVGLDRYGSILQAGNGRDARRDLIEELGDGVVYAMQVRRERNEGGAAAAAEAYDHLLRALFWAVQIPEAGHG